MFYNKKQIMIFHCPSKDFSYWRIVVPHSSQKNQLFSPPVESPHHNLITYMVFSIIKESNCQYNPLSNFPPTASKNTPQVKFPTTLKCPGLFKNWWGGGGFIQYIGNYGGRESLEKGKGGVWGEWLSKKYIYIST